MNKLLRMNTPLTARPFGKVRIDLVAEASNELLLNEPLINIYNAFLITISRKDRPGPLHPQTNGSVDKRACHFNVVS